VDPLRSIGIYAQLLLREHRDQLSPVGTEYLAFITGSVAKMNTLTNAADVGRDGVRLVYASSNSFLIVFAKGLSAGRFGNRDFGTGRTGNG
jgi:hypothetical protein